MEVLLDYLFEEDNAEENTHQKTTGKAAEEPITTTNDVKFSREEINKWQKALMTKEHRELTESQPVFT